MGWIYKITCDINDKVYIGKTEDINPFDRWKEHQRDYKRRKCEKRPLYNAINCYGLEHFYFEVIEEAENGQYLCEREKYYIEKYRTYVGYEDCKGYNATLGGDGKSYLNLDVNDVIKIHIQNNYMIGLTAKHFDVDSGSIEKILTKYNIKWMSNSEILAFKFKQKYGGIVKMNEARDEILDIYDSVNIAISSNSNYKRKTLKCAYRKNSKTHYAYGYIWYRLYELPEEYNELLCNYYENHGACSPGSFHSLYGRYNNTLEQLQEYINNKRRELGAYEYFDIYEYMSNIEDDNLEIDDDFYI